MGVWHHSFCLFNHPQNGVLILKKGKPFILLTLAVGPYLEQNKKMKWQVAYSIPKVSSLYHNGCIYRHIEESGLVQRPTLNKVQEGLLCLFYVHANECLMVHSHVFFLYIYENPRWQTMCHHLSVIPFTTCVITKLDLGP